MSRGPVVYDTPQRVSVCQDCGTGVPDFRVCGALAKRCTNCKKLRASAYQKRINPARLIEVSVCIDCGLEYEKSTRATRRERCDLCRKAYNAAQRKEWADAHLSDRKRIARKWFEANRAIVKNAKHVRRLHERASGERFTRDEVFERDGWVCQLCGDPVDPSLKFPDRGSASLDHCTPIALGGDHTRANTQLAHMGCNWDKGARSV